jgi:5'-AMP-activated protein kinase catalytic alpha subunit
VLHTNAQKRINIEEIRDHPWYKKRQFSLNIDKGYILGVDKINFDEQIIDQILLILKEESLTKEKILKLLNKNSHNNITTT